MSLLPPPTFFRACRKEHLTCPAKPSCSQQHGDVNISPPDQFGACRDAMVTVSLGVPEMAAASPAQQQQQQQAPEPVDLLVLGAGWTSRFLLPLLDENKVQWAATTTTGRDGTIPFRFDPDPDSEDPAAPYRALPTARTVLITFPLKGEGQSRRLTSLYASSRPPTTSSTGTGNTRWIQLGSAGIFSSPGWNDESSPYDAANPRAVAEDELLSSCGVDAVVLALAGLHDGDSRDPRDWVLRVARSKDAVRAKGALHLVHGVDVARAVLAVHVHFHSNSNSSGNGRRWIVADTRCYDWWDLMQAWGAEARSRLREGKTKAAVAAREAGAVDADGLRYEEWVAELMQEEGVRALPRPPERLGRVLDSRAFWREMGTWPVKGRV